MNGCIVLGTASDVGKTMICTALCRLLSNEGIRVAPFKSQNMSRFQATTPTGEIISKAQFLQAEAARTIPSVEMNPILLQPIGNMQSKLFLLGQSEGIIQGFAYRERYYETGVAAIKQALQSLEEQYDTIVIEGAGSPAEVNLNDRELVNMRVAELADVNALLVADISKGGAIASVVGTLQLLSEHHRARVKGIIINQFHGDPKLFQEGVQFIEDYCNIPVVGIIPYKDGHGIEEEDKDQIAQYRTDDERFDEWAAHVKSHVDWKAIRQLFVPGG